VGGTCAFDPRPRLGRAQFRFCGPAFGDQARELVGRFSAMAGMTPGRDPGGILERQIESSEVDQ
jgi:hypothetical protein